MPRHAMPCRALPRQRPSTPDADTTRHAATCRPPPPPASPRVVQRRPSPPALGPTRPASTCGPPHPTPSRTPMARWRCRRQPQQPGGWGRRPAAHSGWRGGQGHGMTCGARIRGGGALARHGVAWRGRAWHGLAWHGMAGRSSPAGMTQPGEAKRGEASQLPAQVGAASRVHVWQRVRWHWGSPEADIWALRRQQPGRARAHKLRLTRQLSMALGSISCRLGWAAHSHLNIPLHATQETRTRPPGSGRWRQRQATPTVHVCTRRVWEAAGSGGVGLGLRLGLACPWHGTGRQGRGEAGA